MRVVIWYRSPNYQVLSIALGVLNRLYGSTQVLGFTNVPESPYSKNKNFSSSIPKNELASLKPDIIIVSGADASMPPVLDEARSLGLDLEKIILDRVVCIPGFTLEKYRRLRRSNLSILSQNCWGGLIYHSFGLPFLSPTVNIYFKERDFLQLLSDPLRTLDAELRFYATAFDEDDQRHYPVMSLGGSKIHMIHYDDEKSARIKWEDRRLRLNWYNLLVMMYTEQQEILEEFDRLPFGKKVCFVPFESDSDCAFFIPPELVRRRKFYEAVNDIAVNKIFCFDLWDMLLYGLRTPIKVNS
mgnify:CR=1 FL=1